MILFLFTTLLFTLAFPIKGGQSDDVLRNWNRVRSRNKFFDRLLDGKVLSTLLVVISLSFYTVITQSPVSTTVSDPSQGILLVSAMWLLSVAPSMGEEYGALLGRKYGSFSTNYGIKKAIQRGMWMGACMAFGTGSVLFIPFALLYAPLAYIALNYAPKKVLDPWGWSEVLVGFFVFGLPFYLHLS